MTLEEYMTRKLKIIRDLVVYEDLDDYGLNVIQLAEDLIDPSPPYIDNNKIIFLLKHGTWNIKRIILIIHSQNHNRASAHWETSRLPGGTNRYWE